MAKDKKPKQGRPSKIKDEMAVRFAAYLAGEGKTDAQIAKEMGVTEQTVNNWKKAEPSFFESLKIEKEKADSSVEKSLYQRACGYTAPDEKIFYDSKTGEPVKVKTFKHYPPDPTSMIFWLKNRQPKKWRDKVDEKDESIDEMEFGDE